MYTIYRRQAGVVLYSLILYYTFSLLKLWTLVSILCKVSLESHYYKLFNPLLCNIVIWATIYSKTYIT